MRIRNLLLASALLMGVQGFAQNFDGFNYQAVIRNAAGDPLPNQSVGVRFIIVSGILQPHIETFSVTTDAQGMIKLSMGQGTLQGGPAFSAIDWSNNSAWTYCVDVDITGGTNYQSLGCDSFKAVPFAMRSLKSDAGPPSGWSLSGNDLLNTNSGNVGIGTTTPGSKLDVVGSGARILSGGTGTTSIAIGRNTTPEVTFGVAANVNNYFTGTAVGDGVLRTDNAANKLVLGTGIGTAATMVVTGSNVGIGNTAPIAKLDIAGTFKLVDGSQGVNKVLTSDANGLASWVAPSAGVGWSLSGNNLTNTNTGNVGIGGSPGGARLYINHTTSSISSPAIKIELNGSNMLFYKATIGAAVIDNTSGGHLSLMPNTGNVGIGTTSPTDKLTVQTGSSNYGFTHTDGTVIVGSFVGGSSGGGWYGTRSNHNLHFFTNNAPAQLTLTTAGNVGIGTTTPQSKLAVNGKITCKEVEVTLAGFPDYVFEKDYRLMPLAEVEAYIAANGHLPHVPSACEVEENGLGLGEMNKILLEKVEELTLHLIEKDQQIQMILERLGTMQAGEDNR